MFLQETKTVTTSAQLTEVARSPILDLLGKEEPRSKTKRLQASIHKEIFQWGPFQFQISEIAIASTELVFSNSYNSHIFRVPVSLQILVAVATELQRIVKIVTWLSTVSSLINHLLLYVVFNWAYTSIIQVYLQATKTVTTSAQKVEVARLPM